MNVCWLILEKFTLRHQLIYSIIIFCHFFLNKIFKIKFNVYDVSYCTGKCLRIDFIQLSWGYQLIECWIFHFQNVSSRNRNLVHDLGTKLCLRPVDCVENNDIRSRIHRPKSHMKRYILRWRLNIFMFRVNGLFSLHIIKWV